MALDHDLDKPDLKKTYIIDIKIWIVQFLIVSFMQQERQSDKAVKRQVGGWLDNLNEARN